MNELDFEKPIIELEKKIAELKKFSESKKIDLSIEIKRLEEKLETIRHNIFENLTPWQRVQIARHPLRPYTLDYINIIMNDFIEFHGDRLFGDDKAIVGGFALLEKTKVCVLGHQKGRDTKENIYRNFGCAHPEGYRKALRLMQMAEKFKIPVIVFIDTPGAYPGIGAEERGQAHSIAYNLREMVMLKTPIVVVVIGEGGSGGALGMGVGDRILMLENSYYSVISPEGCAAILWRDRSKASESAEALRLTAEDLLELGIIDEVLAEPLGGAHRNPEEVAETIKKAIKRHLKELCEVPLEELLAQRYRKYRRIGVWKE
ncbi:MAG: acetyl-CoA carboxylase carboxyltransferase subunit alpha [Candidatus Omnitrophica bacterium]|nr:acetyl-CoA carboxylase carboxyltransferase subunit alpha [Candidatus Omnitrophota bacterium]MCM8798468.1 acetyl-CoA carboxylase carboxyltransferase subunit alpha [Candidatus Omnitrophota bacterium]